TRHYESAYTEGQRRTHHPLSRKGLVKRMLYLRKTRTLNCFGSNGVWLHPFDILALSAPLWCLPCHRICSPVPGGSVEGESVELETGHKRSPASQGWFRSPPFD